MQNKSAVLTVLVLLGVSVILAGCPRPHHHRHRPHIPRPHHLSQPQVPLISTVSFIQAEAIASVVR